MSRNKGRFYWLGLKLPASLSTLILLSSIFSVGCDQERSRPLQVDADSAALSIRVVFGEVPMASRPVSALGIDKVTAQVNAPGGQVLKRQDLNIAGSSFWGRVEVASGDSLSLSLAFFEAQTLRWYGQTDGISAIPGSVVEVTVFADPLQPLLAVSIPASEDTSAVLQWPAFPGATGYELQEAAAEDFSDATTIFRGTDTLFVKTGSRAKGVLYYRARVQHPLGFGPWSLSAEATVPNLPPIADAGSDVSTTTVGVSLDGSASYDPDDDALVFTWAVPDGGVLSDATSVRPIFSASSAGSYLAVLVVNDGETDSLPDTIAITVSQENQPPVADAGSDLEVTIGTVVTLDGSASYDPDGGTLSHSWASDNGPDLTDADDPSPSFTAAELGSFSFSLTVTDDSLSTDTDEVVITVVPPNQRPVANAGPDQTVEAGQPIQLDGSASSDPDGDVISFGWSTTEAGLSDWSVSRPTFVTSTPGTYRFSLVVNDGELASDSDEVVITVIKGNARPIARAGDDQRVTVDDLVLLDGRGSSDADGDDLSYEWSSPSAVIQSVSSSRPTFRASEVGTYLITLVVSDGRLESVADVVTITVVELPTTCVEDFESNARVWSLGESVNSSTSISAGRYTIAAKSEGAVIANLCEVRPGTTMRYEASLRRTEGSGSLGIITGITNAWAYLQFTIEDHKPYVGYWNALDWERYEWGSNSAANLSNFNNFRIDVSKGRIQCFLNGVEVVSMDFEIPLSYRNVGFSVGPNTTVEIESFTVTSLGNESDPTETTDGSADIVGQVEDDTGDAEIVGEVEDDTGDAEIVGEVEETTGDAEIRGTVDG